MMIIDKADSSVEFEILSPPLQSRDVLLGKQSDCFYHAGTIAFRILVLVKMGEYMMQPRRTHPMQKNAVISDVASDILSTGGRFLKRVKKQQDQHDSGTDCWLVLCPKEIHEKIGTSFRDAVKALRRSNMSIDQRIEKFREFIPIVRYYFSLAQQEPIVYAHILVEVLTAREEEKESSRWKARTRPPRPVTTTASNDSNFIVANSTKKHSIL